MDDALHELTQRAGQVRHEFMRLEQEVGRVVVGQQDFVRRLSIGLLVDGHVLVEGAPGLAKSLTVHCFAECIDLSFRRVQFTPDLLPSDLIGTLILDPRTQEFRPRLGPIFASIVLADEINRAPPKVQSALLEAMQERQVSLGEGTHPLPSPFMVMATQNPLEQEGTYPLPEAELDRFLFKVALQAPSLQDEVEILSRHGNTRLREPLRAVLDAAGIAAARAVLDELHVDPQVLEYVVRVARATREAAMGEAAVLRHGVSSRAARALLLAAKGRALLEGRAYLTPFDVKQCAEDVFAHRLGLSWETQASGRGARDIVRDLLAVVEVP